MLWQLATLAGTVVTGLALMALVYVLGMRAKSRLVLGPLLWLQRAVINPRQLRSAGTPGAYAAIIRHRGRISGRLLDTPVGAVATDDGFAVGLVYGSRSNWLKNVLASGSATLLHEGSTYDVNGPEIVPMRSVESYFTAGDRRGFHLFAVNQALRLRRAETAATRTQLVARAIDSARTHVRAATNP